jgi:methyltransferase-like protein
MLKAVSDDTIRMEQYMDFVRNRMFRQTLVCRKSVALQREPQWETMLNLFVSSNSQPEETVELRSSKPVSYARPGSTMMTREPLVKAAMQYLAEQWPKSVPFQELVTMARRKLDPTPQLLSPERVRHEQRAIATPLLRCFATTHVDLSVCPTPFSLNAGDYPAVPRLARYQAQNSNQVTNLMHQTISVSDLQRHLIQRLDGKHDRSQLVEFLVDQVAQGKLVAHDEGTEVRGEERVREMLTDVLESSLNSLASKWLFTA